MQWVYVQLLSKFPHKILVVGGRRLSWEPNEYPPHIDLLKKNEHWENFFIIIVMMGRYGG